MLPSHDEIIYPKPFKFNPDRLLKDGNRNSDVKESCAHHVWIRVEVECFTVSTRDDCTNGTGNYAFYYRECLGATWHDSQFS
jgi:hypothetical protein